MAEQSGLLRKSEPNLKHHNWLIEYYKDGRWADGALFPAYSAIDLNGVKKVAAAKVAERAFDSASIFGYSNFNGAKVLIDAVVREAKVHG